MNLAIDRSADCWTLTLDRPDKANALSAALVDELRDAVAAAGAAGTAVLVLRGSGRNFSAGFDMADIETQSEADLLQRFVRIELLLQEIERSPCLTVALAHGRNFGAGVDLIAACRWRVAAPGTAFRMPGLAFGIVLGTRRFAALVGRDRARAILESLETFDAARAAEIGFATRVVATEEWPAVVADAQSTARVLPAASRALLYGVLDAAQHDADLAALTRSAADAGLKDRIRAYLAAQQAARPPRA